MWLNILLAVSIALFLVGICWLVSPNNAWFPWVITVLSTLALVGIAAWKISGYTPTGAAVNAVANVLQPSAPPAPQ